MSYVIENENLAVDIIVYRGTYGGDARVYILEDLGDEIEFRSMFVPIDAAFEYPEDDEALLDYLASIHTRGYGEHGTYEEIESSDSWNEEDMQHFYALAEALGIA